MKSSSISTKGNRQHLQYYHGVSISPQPQPLTSKRLTLLDCCTWFTKLFHPDGQQCPPLDSCVSNSLPIFDLYSCLGVVSQVFMYEVQAGYIGQMISGCMNSGIKYVQVRKGPTTAYNSWLEKRLRNTVLVEAQSYMRSEGGTGRVFVSPAPRLPVRLPQWNKKNTVDINLQAPWPGPGYLFWWHNRTVEWGDYIGADKMADAQVFRRRVTNAGLATLISLLLWRYRLTLSATYRCVWS